MRLKADVLVVERGGRPVIDEMSFTAAAGEAVVLSGPNGSGKTTLLRTLAGYLRPSAGSVRLEGGDPELTLNEQAHVVGHANAVKLSLTVGENLNFWSQYLTGAAPDSQVISKALQHFGLEDLVEFPAAILSAGQKRRLGLARLLAAHRPLWLLDEPTVSLDAASAERFAAAVNDHTGTGGLAVIATHLPLGLERARTVTIASGRIAA